MGLKNGFLKILHSLGTNNDPLIAVLGIAVFKGVFRPLFTMMDKEEKPERKKYAAFREGLTEAIAFCSYFATSKLAKLLAKPICKAAKDPKILVEGKEQFKNLHKVEKSLSFIAVCLAAFAVIPSICNLTLKPIMESAQKLQKHKKDLENKSKLDVKENVVPEKPALTNLVTPSISDNARKLLATVNPAGVRNGNMKVGG